ncbi:protein PHYTOCHROME KINASE SUBSTRATE 3-like [Impatiens glandulifera]|uniref:protein PHYTOCHROME KINASE SUBSTRATE 3-like n=1 Tax=Impatiens glandulifera TaxID=253017 RepID=UPI001FB18DD8|nr:protein PHYTOCHROME KINASE SUBSTRATE 3-like [Impatiens glandulifera]
MDIQDNLRVASFSAYLNPGDQESFALKIATIVQEAIPTSMCSEETPRVVSFRRTKPDHKESEISVFGTNKYLNIKMEYNSSKPAEEKEHIIKSRSLSSWNSQSLLLENPTRIKPKKRRGFFKRFVCQGPCRGNKSDRVDHGMMVLDSSKRSQDQNAFKKENPDLSKKVLTEEPRNSIEVFGSQAAKKGDDISKNLERKLSMLTWDAIPKKNP